MPGYKTGATTGFHFAGLDAEEVNTVRAQLNTIARSFGYVSRARSQPGQGSAAALLVAIARGELKVVRPDEPEERDIQIARSA